MKVVNHAPLALFEPDFPVEGLVHHGDGIFGDVDLLAGGGGGDGLLRHEGGESPSRTGP